MKCIQFGDDKNNAVDCAVIWGHMLFPQDAESREKFISALMTIRLAQKIRANHEDPNKIAMTIALFDQHAEAMRYLTTQASAINLLIESGKRAGKIAETLVILHKAHQEGKTKKPASLMQVYDAFIGHAAEVEHKTNGKIADNRDSLGESWKHFKATAHFWMGYFIIDSVIRKPLIKEDFTDALLEEEKTKFLFIARLGLITLQSIIPHSRDSALIGQDDSYWFTPEVEATLNLCTYAEPVIRNSTFHGLLSDTQRFNGARKIGKKAILKKILNEKHK